MRGYRAIDPPDRLAVLPQLSQIGEQHAQRRRIDGIREIQVRLLDGLHGRCGAVRAALGEHLRVFGHRHPRVVRLFGEPAETVAGDPQAVGFVGDANPHDHSLGVARIGLHMASDRVERVGELAPHSVEFGQLQPGSRARRICPNRLAVFDDGALEVPDALGGLAREIARRRIVRPEQDSGLERGERAGEVALTEENPPDDQVPECGLLESLHDAARFIELLGLDQRVRIREEKGLRGIGAQRDRVIESLESLVEFVAPHVEIGEREPGGWGASLLGFRAQQSLLFFGVAGPFHQRGERCAEDAVPALLQSGFEDLDCTLALTERLIIICGPLHDDRHHGELLEAFLILGFGDLGFTLLVRKEAARDAQHRLERRVHLLARVVELLARVFDRFLRLVDLVRCDQRRHAGNQNGKVVGIEFEYPLDVYERVLIAAGPLVGLDAKNECGNVFGLELEYLIDDRNGIGSRAALQHGTGQQHARFDRVLGLFRSRAQWPDRETPVSGEQQRRPEQKLDLRVRGVLIGEDPQLIDRLHIAFFLVELANLDQGVFCLATCQPEQGDADH